MALRDRYKPTKRDIKAPIQTPGKKSLDELNAINKEIKLQLEERAIALPGYTTLKDMYCIRIAISNHRTTNEDFDELVYHIIKIANELG